MFAKSEIKAIETEYNGCKFRSRLEARWAVYLDNIGWNWDYEPEGFELEGEKYLPDFKIYTPGYDPNSTDFIWFEIKPDKADESSIRKAKKLVYFSKKTLLFGVGCPDPKKISYGLDGIFTSDKEKSWQELKIVEDCGSLCSYCFMKWKRPGWFMYTENPEKETIAACNAAKSAQFEFLKKLNNDYLNILNDDGYKPLFTVIEKSLDNLHTDDLIKDKKSLDWILATLVKVKLEGNLSTEIDTEFLLAKMCQKLGIERNILDQRMFELTPRTKQISEFKRQTEQMHPKPSPEEKELMELLLANPDLVVRARHEIHLDQWNHPELKQVAGVLYALHDEGTKPELDVVRNRLDDCPIKSLLFGMAANGRRNPDPFDCYFKLSKRFKEKATTSHDFDFDTAIKFLRDLQQNKQN